MEEYTTEYLIMHEDELDWDELSKNPNRSFSLVEIRLFRKRIDWGRYLVRPEHINSITSDMLELASKYFNKSTYTILSLARGIPEDFVLKHRTDFNIGNYILNNKPSEEFLLATIDEWKDNDTVRTAIPIKIDLSQEEYKNIKLLYEVE